MSTINSLPTELIQIQLSHFDLLESLFLPGEFTPSQETIDLLSDLESKLDQSTISLAAGASLDCTVLIPLDPPPDAQPGPHSVELSISLALSLADSDSPQPLQLAVKQPSWLSRSAHQSLANSLASLPQEDDPTTAVLGALELLRDAGAGLIPLVVADVGAAAAGAVEDECRVWFWLQSLSTRAKRDNMVKWAPGFGLTGFVMAGKPGLLCCEGTPTNIQSYMNDIKSISWADIPSFQKKITERYRVPLSSSCPRAFDKMIEITDLISKGGGRQNRGEMGEVRDWLDGRGLGDDFALVIGNGSF